MNPYYELLYLVWTHQPCTRFHIENLRHGRFSEQFDTCIQLQYIHSVGKNINDDVLYEVTDEGKQIIDNPKEVQS